MCTKFNKKVCYKCSKCRKVLEVDTLVHLYDSLNNQIEIAWSEMKDFMQVGISSDFSDEAKAKFEAVHTEMEKRFEKLINIRTTIEDLLDKNLKAEVIE